MQLMYEISKAIPIKKEDKAVFLLLPLTLEEGVRYSEGGETGKGVRVWGRPPTNG